LNQGNSDDRTHRCEPGRLRPRASRSTDALPPAQGSAGARSFCKNTERGANREKIGKLVQWFRTCRMVESQQRRLGLSDVHTAA
jgi:hypothetical protein